MGTLILYDLDAVGNSSSFLSSPLASPMCDAG